MGYKSFSVVLVLSLISTLPLACGSDDDSNPPSTAGKGGGGGNGGSAGKGGTAGTAGKGSAGTAGKAGAGTAGTTPGAAGEGGSAPNDNVGGEAGAAAAGMGGESAAGAESGGAGGEAGEAGADDAAAERMVKCETVCHFQVQSAGPETGSDPASCKGNPDDCAMDFCVNQIQHTPTCFAALDSYLDCALTVAGDQDLYCSEGTDADPLLGTVRTDFSTMATCPEALGAYTACLPQQ